MTILWIIIINLEEFNIKIFMAKEGVDFDSE